MPIKFKTKTEAEKYLRKLNKTKEIGYESLEKRVEKLEKKDKEKETRLNNIWTIILTNNLSKR